MKKKEISERAIFLLLFLPNSRLSLSLSLDSKKKNDALDPPFAATDARCSTPIEQRQVYRELHDCESGEGAF